MKQKSNRKSAEGSGHHRNVGDHHQAFVDRRLSPHRKPDQYRAGEPDDFTEGNRKEAEGVEAGSLPALDQDRLPGGQHAQHNHRQRQAKTQNPQLPVKIPAVTRNQRGLYHQQNDPAGEDCPVNVDDHAGQRARVKYACQEVGAREPDEHDHRDQAGHRGEDPREVFPQAKEFAGKALERDIANAQAHKSLAVVQNLYDWDWAGSEQEVRRALQLDPSLSDAHSAYSILLSCLRRYEKAIQEALWASRLDPLSVTMNALLGFIYMRARQYSRAIEACREAIELDPNNSFGHWLLARSLDGADLIPEALEEAHQAAKLSGDRSPYLGHLGCALARAGDPDGASRVVESLRAREKNEYISPFEFVNIFNALGKSDLALEYLERAYQERTPRLSGELWDRPFDGLRSDPRFQDLIRRIGLRDQSV